MSKLSTILLIISLTIPVTRTSAVNLDEWHYLKLLLKIVDLENKTSGINSRCYVEKAKSSVSCTYSYKKTIKKNEYEIYFRILHDSVREAIKEAYRATGSDAVKKLKVAITDNKK